MLEHFFASKSFAAVGKAFSNEYEYPDKMYRIRQKTPTVMVMSPKHTTTVAAGMRFK
jgi:hypothetical protein